MTKGPRLSPPSDAGGGGGMPSGTIGGCMPSDPISGCIIGGCMPSDPILPGPETAEKGG